MEERDLAQLAREIEQARRQLHQAVQDADNDLHDATVRRLSTSLDVLIAAYVRQQRGTEGG